MVWAFHFSVSPVLLHQRSIAVVMRIVEEHLDAQRNREMAMAKLGFLKATERGKDKEISCCNCFALKSHMFCEG
ncbi:hypothetical protein LWI29_033425 [Acer saccharum]|uniref:Uncharacterized protein n=1 Tax=Acer saccharum TaxID=4024 RepID=A0AA39VSG6_ACESA|nr:hypothetical protein LWI29_033425 [Acer saccharum]KAK1568649.1 hypothetical protein Q3G72_027155 [Acer saccharum]